MASQTRTHIRRLRKRFGSGTRVQEEAAALRQRVGELKGHIEYLARRLHLAEYIAGQLSEVGFTGASWIEPKRFARWLSWSPPGHFYSPIPDERELDAAAERIWPEKWPTELPGIDLRAEEQLAMFSTVAKFGREFEIYDRPTAPWRYHTDNTAYGAGDALTLHGMLRHLRPQRLIEIGSGYSSAMTLDTVEHYLDGTTQLTFIEPYPQLLSSLLHDSDREHVTIVPRPVQDVPLDLFSTLQAGDILFIDSTHVLKTGSDVAWLYANVVSNLNEGVYIHIHDMFHPFEYPRIWVMEGRAWTEAYLVRAFLSFNSDFEIVLFNDWLAVHHFDRIETELPPMAANTGGALWLRRTRASRPILTS
jgi:Methyltransferase domain